MGVKIKKLHEDAVIPRYAHEGDSGFDLVAVEDIIVEPGETVKVPIGLAFEIPRGYELQIRPRSGITTKTKLRVQFGTVDSPYRGPVAVSVDNIARGESGSTPLLRKLSGKVENYNRLFYPKKTYVIRKGDRIAQGVIAPVIRARFMPTKELSDTTRGTDGFGSTGVSE